MIDYMWVGVCVHGTYATNIDEKDRLWRLPLPSPHAAAVWGGALKGGEREREVMREGAWGLTLRHHDTLLLLSSRKPQVPYRLP